MKKSSYITIIKVILFMILFVSVVTPIDNTNYNYLPKENIDEVEDVFISTDDITDKSSDSNITNLSVLKEKNVIGTIRIEGTDINTKFTQTTNNSYYLDHDIYGQYYVLGNVFMDYRNKPSDRKLLLYGHNSSFRDGAPFHDLEKYSKYSYFSKHQFINLNYNGENSVWQIFSVMIVSNKSTTHTQINFSDSKWQEHLKWMKNNSLYDTNVSVSTADKVLTLQTCIFTKSDSLIIINAKKI